MPTPASKIDNLVRKLQAAAHAYYNGQPVMSDAVYDALADELAKLDPTNPFLVQVGAAPSGGAWPKVKHGRPMGSLNKAQYQPTTDGSTPNPQPHAELYVWGKKCGARPGVPLVITDKMDGASLSLRYENGKFVQGVTRGDGTTCEDITRNALLMKGVIKVIPGGFTGYLRGEVIVTRSDFKAYFPGQSNPRNTANGTMKRQSDAEGCKHLTVVMFDVLSDGTPISTKSDELTLLRTWGFTTPRWSVVNGLDAVCAEYDAYVASVRASLDYDIDGLVVQFDSQADMERLGDEGKGPKGAIAYKFPHEEKETILRGIRWQVGNSGRVTPVALFDEVLLAGAKVKQASLHNCSNIESLCNAQGAAQFAEGDSILVCRRNDVIPYVEALLSSNTTGTVLTVPTECPDCKTILMREGEYLVCRGDSCPAQVSGAIKRWISKIGVLHFGDALVEALIDAGMVETIPDLYTVDVAQASNLIMGQRRVGGTADKAFKNLHARKELDLATIVGSLGIDLIGREMAQVIVDAGYDTLDKMAKAKLTDIAAIPGVGPTKAAAFIKGYWANISIIAGLLSVGVTVKKANDGPLKGKSFCLTGFRDQALSDALRALGATEKSSVGRDLTYLVTADPKSTSGKAQKAHEYNASGKANITILGIPDAYKLAGLPVQP